VPLLFFQSQQGVIFAVIALVLLALFLYGGEIGRGGGWVHRGIFSPILNEEKRANRLLARQLEGTEKKIEHTGEALEKFSTAVAEYAKHLASHTSAIQGLSEASHELKRGASEQNRVLSAIMENMGKPGQRQDTIVIKQITTPGHLTPKQPAEKPLHFHDALAKGAVSCARKHWVTNDDKSKISH
jgi:uncharacterized membrane-anchored protein YhcB (DUF1043 family)